jgi:hypothetical protein
MAWTSSVPGPAGYIVGFTDRAYVLVRMNYRCACQLSTLDVARALAGVT